MLIYLSVRRISTKARARTASIRTIQFDEATGQDRAEFLARETTRLKQLGFTVEAEVDRDAWRSWAVTGEVPAQPLPAKGARR